MIVNLRGPSGSGKSYVGHQLLDGYPHEEIFEDGWNKFKPRLIGYKLPGNFYLLGSYRAAGGGLDTLSPHDRSALLPLIERYAKLGHVFFEALVISSTVVTYIELANKIKQPFIFAFLDTPADLCIQQVYLRNGGKPIKEDLIRGHHKYMQRVQQRIDEAGLQTATIDHTRSVDDVVELFRQGGWDPGVSPELTTALREAVVKLHQRQSAEPVFEDLPEW
jgi:hypothetical protein